MKRQGPQALFLILFLSIAFIRWGTTTEKVYGQTSGYYWGSDSGYSLEYIPKDVEKLYYPEQNFYIAKIGCGDSSEGCINQESAWWDKPDHTQITGAAGPDEAAKSRYVYWYLKGPPGTVDDYGEPPEVLEEYGREQADSFWRT